MHVLVSHYRWRIEDSLSPEVDSSSSKLEIPLVKIFEWRFYNLLMVIRAPDLNAPHDAITNAFISQRCFTRESDFALVAMQKCDPRQVQLFSS